MEKTQEGIAFYKIFFDEGLYLVKEKNTYPADKPKADNLLSESLPAYKTEGIPSKTLVMFEGKLTEADILLLDQVLKAVGLGFDKVTRLNTTEFTQKLSWEAISGQSHADQIICFGINKEYMPNGIADGEIYNSNNKRVLCAPALSALALNNSAKKVLWMGLKEIFGL